MKNLNYILAGIASIALMLTFTNILEYVAVIFMFRDRPSKHHNITKFLWMILPSGIITLLSVTILTLITPYKQAYNAITTLENNRLFGSFMVAFVVTANGFISDKLELHYEKVNNNQPDKSNDTSTSLTYKKSGDKNE